MTKKIEENSIQTQNLDTEASVDQNLILKDLMRVKGVGTAQAEKLYNAQIYSVEQLAAMPVGELMDRTGFAKKAVETLQQSARPLCDFGEIVDATERLKEENDSIFLSTGSAQFDELIGGGYPIGLITEIHAKDGVGKTQAVFTASVMATLPLSEGGLDGDVMYIDTEGTFSAKRIKEISDARKLDTDKVLSRIHCIRVVSAAQQVLVMDKVNEVASTLNIKLIVVDSVIATFRADFAGGRQILPERQGLLNKHLTSLKQFAKNHKAVIICTNQMSANPDAGMFMADSQPVGGLVLGHNCAIRIGIRKGKAGTRVIRLEKSNTRATGECIVELLDKGICDKKASKSINTSSDIKD